MTDYYVKCVNTDADGNISSVGHGSQVDKYVAGTKSKATVIADIDEHPQQDVKTAYYSPQQDDWVVGDSIHTVDGEYIRTDGNEIRSDNLDHLNPCPDSI